MREDSVFSALSDPSRRRLLEALADRESASLTELAAGLPVTRQAVSKHLAVLGQAGLVESARAGRETHYSLTPRPLVDALAWMELIGDRWDERLARLREHVAGSQAVPGRARHRRKGGHSSSR
jgi:DNA-binding transcriptional ArsR family regulator